MTPDPLKIALDPLGRLRLCIDIMEREAAKGADSTACTVLFTYATATTDVMAMLSYSPTRFEGHSRVKFRFMPHGRSAWRKEINYRTVREAGEAMVGSVATFDGGVRAIQTMDVMTSKTHHGCSNEEEAIENHFRAFGDEFKRDLMAAAWAPHRHVDWCLDIEEQRALAARA